MGPIVFRDPLSPLGHPGYPPEAANAGKTAVEYGIGREEQDEWAYRSQMKYQEAKKAGKFEDWRRADSVEVPQKKGPLL